MRVRGRGSVSDTQLQHRAVWFTRTDINNSCDTKPRWGRLQLARRQNLRKTWRRATECVADRDAQWIAACGLDSRPRGGTAWITIPAAAKQRLRQRSVRVRVTGLFAWPRHMKEGRHGDGTREISSEGKLPQDPTLQTNQSTEMKSASRRGPSLFQKGGMAIPSNIRRGGGQSLLILEGREGNPL